MKHLDDMEELFQQRFESFESEPADDAWEKIEEQIAPQTPQNRWTSLAYRGGLLSVLLLLLLSYFFINTPQNTTSNTLLQTKNTSQERKKSTDNQIVTNKKESIENSTKKINEATDFARNGQVTEEATPITPTLINHSTSTKTTPNTRPVTTAVIDKTQYPTVSQPANNTQKNSIITFVKTPKSSEENTTISGNSKQTVTPTNADTENKNLNVNVPQLSEKATILQEANQESIAKNSIKNTANQKIVSYLKKSQNDINQVPITPQSETQNSETTPTQTKTPTPQSVIPKSWQIYAKNLLRPIPTYHSGIVQAVPKPRTSREVYVSVMPIYNFYRIQTNDNDRFQVEDVQIGNADSRIGYRAEVGTFFDLSERVRLRTGISFSQTNQNILYRLKTDSIQVKRIDNQGIEISRAVLDKSITEQHQYAGLRIDAQYLLFEGNIDHYVSLGLDGQVGLTRQTPHNISLTLGYQLAKPIGKNFTLWVEPTLSQSLIGQKFDNSLLNINASRIGFHFGATWLVSY